MYCVVGLGNAGRRYADTRHNAGFWVVQALAADLMGASARWEEKLHCAYARDKIGDIPVILVHPLGYMNESGERFAPFFRFYKLELEKLVVIYDELDLPPGVIRLKHGGSSGGHRGVEDLIRHLGSSSFTRLRFGIGHPRDYLPEGVTLSENAVSNWVLSEPQGEEMRLVFKNTLPRAVGALKTLITEGLREAQQQYHPN